MNFYKRSTHLFKIAVLSSSFIALNACNRNSATKAVNEVAKATKSCKSFNTDSQADGENLVKRTLFRDYKFNLYWSGNSKFYVWENKGADDKYTANLNPLVVHVLDANNRETDTITCAKDKISASRCIDRFAKLNSLMSEARKSMADRGAAMSEGKEFTFKCTKEFIDQKIKDLSAI
jgi:hypothetical protein